MKQTNRDLLNVSGRDRLLATARDLFVSRGASNVGINDVTGRAGVAKMTLYNNFASKEALVLAVYEEMIEADLRELKAMHTTAQAEEERIVALFDHYESKAYGADYRGCPFIHASLQDAEPSGAIYDLVHAYKRALREHVLSLMDKGRKNRAELADQILILLDGAVTERYLKGVAHALRPAKRAAIILLRFTE